MGMPGGFGLDPTGWPWNAGLSARPPQGTEAASKAPGAWAPRRLASGEAGVAPAGATHRTSPGSHPHPQGSGLEPLVLKGRVSSTKRLDVRSDPTSAPLRSGAAAGRQDRRRNVPGQQASSGGLGGAVQGAKEQTLQAPQSPAGSPPAHREYRLGAPCLRDPGRRLSPPPAPPALLGLWLQVPREEGV